jgi:hypothetical protein
MQFIKGYASPPPNANDGDYGGFGDFGSGLETCAGCSLSDFGDSLPRYYVEARNPTPYWKGQDLMQPVLHLAGFGIDTTSTPPLLTAPYQDPTLNTWSQDGQVSVTDPMPSQAAPQGVTLNPGVVAQMQVMQPAIDASLSQGASNTKLFVVLGAGLGIAAAFVLWQRSKRSSALSGYRRKSRRARRSRR